MSKVESNLLTPNQFSKLIILGIISVSILSLPNDVVTTAKQDGWISVILGAIYPLYVILCSLYIVKRCPKESILELNKKFFGKLVGNLLNVVMLFKFTFYLVFETSGVSNFFRTYIIEFLPSHRVIFLIVSMAAFCAYKGIKSLGKMSELIFYNLIATMAIGILALTKGSILNVMPVFGSGSINIIKGVRGVIYSYAGMEIILLIHPYINDISKLKDACLKAAAVICSVYTWVTFVTVFYLSHSIIPKATWSSLYIFESIRVPIINNFRIIMMSFWLYVSIITVSISYFVCGLTTVNMFKRLKKSTFYLLTVPVMFSLSMLLSEEVKRREILNLMIAPVVIFNVTYVFVMVLTVHFKKGKSNE